MSESVLTAFKANRLLPPSLGVVARDEDGISVHHVPQQVSSVAPSYAGRSILVSDGRCRYLKRPTEARALKQSQSLCSSSVMDDFVPKCQRTIDQMEDAAGTVAKEVKVKEEYKIVEIVEVTEPIA